MKHNFFLFLIFLSLYIKCTLSAIYTYENYKIFPNKKQSALSKRVGMFSPEDAPSHTAPGNGDSYVKFHFVITSPTQLSRAEPPTDPFLNIALLSSAHKFPSDTSDFCCTFTHIHDNYCSPDEVGHLLNEGQLNEFNQSVIARALTGEPDNTYVIDEVVRINSTEMMYSYLIFCGMEEDYIIANGNITFLNPFGYLSGQEWYLLPWNAALTVIYLIFSIIWIYSMVKRSVFLLPIHYWITSIILLCLVDFAVKMFDLLGYNNTGEDPLSAFITGSIIGPFRATLFRVVILIVCMGYTVVRKKLTASVSKLVLWAFLFFSFCLTTTVYRLVNRGNESLPWDFLLFALLPLSFLDTIFFLWTFISIYKTVKWLQNKPSQKEKFVLYSYFLKLLIYVMLIAVAQIFIRGVLDSFAGPDATWKIIWFFQASTDILFFVVLLKIALIWRPNSKNTASYAYSDLEIMEIDDSPEDIPLPSMGSLISGTPFYDDKKEAFDHVKSSFSVESEEDTRDDYK